MNASTPPNEMPPFQSTAASGTFPIEQIRICVQPAELALGA
jgi:hypothetical protein